MKIAITGKGGVGKTTIASVLCHLYAAEGRSVIAVDADPDANLASAFGLSDNKPRKCKKCLTLSTKIIIIISEYGSRSVWMRVLVSSPSFGQLDEGLAFLREKA